MPSLPAASAEALAHSGQLVEYIRRQVAGGGGWLSFADYMNLALYAPGLGYYSAGARKFGAAGDFVTAPELTPLFGQALANQAAQVLRAGGGDVLELGAGSGRLAADLLAALDAAGTLPERYLILELSADLRQRQRDYVARAVPGLLPRVQWLERLPTSFAGVVLGNEVLDALPVHLVHRRPDGLFERGVAWAEKGFFWAERPLPEGPVRDAAAVLPVTPAGYLSEIGLAGTALVRSLAAMLSRGLVVFLDYGFPRAEYYHPDRSEGTLMCHYRHHALADPFFLPGLTDITAHVDFTAVADAALEAGLEVWGYATQAHFLVNCGVLELLGRLEPGSTPYLKQAGAVQKLIHPAEMGELFKVIALGKGLDEGLIGFSRGDRRHTL